MASCIITGQYRRWLDIVEQLHQCHSRQTITTYVPLDKWATIEWGSVAWKHPLLIQWPFDSLRCGPSHVRGHVTGNNSLHRGQRTSKDPSGFIRHYCFKTELNVRTSHTVEASMFSSCNWVFIHSRPDTLEMSVLYWGHDLYDSVCHFQMLVSVHLWHNYRLDSFEMNSAFVLSAPFWHFDTVVCCMFQTAEVTNVFWPHLGLTPRSQRELVIIQ